MTHAHHNRPVIAHYGEITPLERAPARQRWSWALYDFANTIFSMNITTLYFAVWIISDLGASNTVVATGNAVSSLFIALSIPVFGAISDARSQRVIWVTMFTLVACIGTVFIGIIGYTMIPFIGEGVINSSNNPPTHWRLEGTTLILILAAFIVANYAYQGALPFYNAMLPELASPEERGRLSGLGTALGYIGSITGVVLIAPFFNGAFPILGQVSSEVLDTFRQVIPFTEKAGRVSIFIPTAILFLIFSLPLFIFCRDRHVPTAKHPVRWREAFHKVVDTLRDSRKYPGALRFILASFLYQDAMGTIIAFMAVYAVKAMGFAEGAEVTLFVALTVPAVLGSYICGFLVDRFGPKRTLMFVIGTWVALLLGMIFAPSQAAFWTVGIGIGLIFGGVATAERPLLLSLIPDVEAGRFFGLMVLSARAAAIVGPFIWAFTVDSLTPVTSEGIAYRAAVGAVAIAMAGSLLLLIRIPDHFRITTRA